MAPPRSIREDVTLIYLRPAVGDVLAGNESVASDLICTAKALRDERNHRYVGARSSLGVLLSGEVADTPSIEKGSGRLGVEMAATTELDRAVTERLAKHELRYTTGRRQIVSGLRRAGGPVTLPELLQIQSDLAQSSAYRNLSLMEDAGVVRRLVHRGDHAHYELAEELTEHHHHLICESCGLVLDVTFSAATERNLDKAFDSVAEAQGFVPRHHVVDVYGRCERCAA